MGKQQILIIEGHQGTQELLKSILGDCYEILVAVNIASALELLAIHKPNLIMRGFEITDKDATELNIKLRFAHPTNVPIIRLNGFVAAKNAIVPSRLLEVVKTFLPPLESTLENKPPILIVDDNPRHIQQMAAELSVWGVNIKTAVDGFDAFAQAREVKPFAIISDILMPHCDGFQLCLQVRNDPELAKIPFFIIASHGIDDAQRELAHQVGATLILAYTPEIANVIMQKLNTRITIPAPLMDQDILDSIHSDYQMRIVRQLEDQMHYSQRLLNMQDFHKGTQQYLDAVASNLIIRPDINIALQKANPLAQDLFKGALYLKENDDSFTLRSLINYPDHTRVLLQKLWGFPALLDHVFNSRSVISLSSPVFNEEAIQTLLQRANVEKGWFIPLYSNKHFIGILFLTPIIEVHEKDFLQFSHILSAQIIQSLMLMNVMERLHGLEEENRSLMQNASCGIAVMDLKGVILQINKEGQKILERNEQAIIGHRFKDFLTEESRLKYTSSLRHIPLGVILNPTHLHFQNNSGFKAVEISAIKINAGHECLINLIMTDKTQIPSSLPKPIPSYVKSPAISTKVGINLKEVIQKVLEEITLLLPDKLTIDMQLAPHFPLLDINNTKLHQLIYNVIVLIGSMYEDREQGAVSIVARYGKCKFQLAFIVEDNIFDAQNLEPFTRFVSIIQQLTLDCGGEIEIQNENIAQVCVYLPLTQQELVV